MCWGRGHATRRERAHKQARMMGIMPDWLWKRPAAFAEPFSGQRQFRSRQHGPTFMDRSCRHRISMGLAGPHTMASVGWLI
ncbi:hypothetical protein KSAC_28000 [Komagataeibacter saccharivorans]|nr:hypothetical protein KSAC_28000 [Komagataeibacter saccharivorans]